MVQKKLVNICYRLFKINNNYKNYLFIFRNFYYRLLVTKCFIILGNLCLLIKNKKNKKKIKYLKSLALFKE
jgi:hypothetical protein